MKLIEDLNNNYHTINEKQTNLKISIMIEL